MKTESLSRITWYVGSRGIIEPRSRRPQAEPALSPRGGHFDAGNWGFGDVAEIPFAGFDSQTERGREAVIVVPIDFSPASLCATETGVSVARHTHSRLVLCHALIPRVGRFGTASPSWLADELRNEAVEKMQPSLRLAEEAGLAAACAIEEGTPADSILKVIRRYAADLVVLTTREYSAWARLLFGPTTAEQVIREAECHVMVLRTADE